MVGLCQGSGSRTGRSPAAEARDRPPEGLLMDHGTDASQVCPHLSRLYHQKEIAELIQSYEIKSISLWIAWELTA